MYLCQDAHGELRVPHLLSPFFWDLTQVIRHGSKCLYTHTQNTQINVKTNKHTKALLGPDKLSVLEHQEWQSIYSVSENNKGFHEKEVQEHRAVCKEIFLARKSISNGVPHQQVAAVSCSEAAPVAPGSSSSSSILPLFRRRQQQSSEYWGKG